MPAFLRHAFLALVCAAAGLLACEWLLPGSVSSRLPVFALAGAAMAAVLAGAACLRPARRWAAFLGFLLLVVPVFLLGIAFLKRAPSPLVGTGVALLGLLAGLAIVAGLLPDEPAA